MIPKVIPLLPEMALLYYYCNNRNLFIGHGLQRLAISEKG